ncbi:hypothetical protein D9611_014585 [Ephemerocybe angulata]|uniref:Uncharacterized protein n=1 Tax=Ephemerocybe angulata TaxID=980116 RepID=A0A8H5FEX3_9AGAR|nr:hypothetical protein D9611_014585 [Tulosesus angulatus]
MVMWSLLFRRPWRGVDFTSSFDVLILSVGESGYGKQPLKYTFEEFVSLRSVLEVPFSKEPNFGGRYPPSSKETLDFFEWCLKARIPSVEELGGKVNVTNVNEASKLQGTFMSWD